MYAGCFFVHLAPTNTEVVLWQRIGMRVFLYHDQSKLNTNRTSIIIIIVCGKQHDFIAAIHLETCWILFDHKVHSAKKETLT